MNFIDEGCREMIRVPRSHRRYSGMTDTPRIPLAHLTAPPNPDRRFRLMEVVRARLRERRYSRRTEQAYVHWIRRYIVYNDRRHPKELGEIDVRRFLSSLATDDRVAASTQNQALAAVTFLYDRVLDRPLTRIDGIQPARRSRHVPTVLSSAEIRAILAKLDEPFRLCAARGLIIQPTVANRAAWRIGRFCQFRAVNG
jgi:hypothetical protein